MEMRSLLWRALRSKLSVELDLTSNLELYHQQTMKEVKGGSVCLSGRFSLDHEIIMLDLESIEII
jgi:hypothetical protein